MTTAQSTLLPPNVVEMEEALLGALLMFSESDLDLLFHIPDLRPDQFFLASHQHIFRAIRSLTGRGEQLTSPGVFTELRDLGLIDEIGGYGALTALMNNAEYADRDPRHIKALAERIDATWRQRQTVEHAQKLAKAAFDNNADGVLANANAVIALASPHPSGQVKLLSYEDIVNRPPVRYLVDDEFIVEGGLTLLYGKSGTGKSFVALDWSLTVAQRRPVVYLAAEGGGGMPDRIAAWMNRRKKEPGRFWLIDRALPLLQSAERAAFVAACTPLKPALIVIDTASRTMGGADENILMGAFVAACDDIRERTGAAVLVIHHEGKSSSGSRGGTQLPGAADQVMELQADGDNLELIDEKVRDGGQQNPRHYVLMDCPARPGNTSKVVEPSANIQRTIDDRLSGQALKLLEALSLDIFREAGAAYTRLCEAAGVPRGNSNRILSSLKERGLVRQATKGEPYYITEAGLKAVQSSIFNQSSRSLHEDRSNHLHSSSHPLRGEDDDDDPKIGGEESPHDDEKRAAIAKDDRIFGVKSMEELDRMSIEDRLTLFAQNATLEDQFSAWIDTRHNGKGRRNVQT